MPRVYSRQGRRKGQLLGEGASAPAAHGEQEHVADIEHAARELGLRLRARSGPPVVTDAGGEPEAGAGAEDVPAAEEAGAVAISAKVEPAGVISIHIRVPARSAGVPQTPLGGTKHQAKGGPSD